MTVRTICFWFQKWKEKSRILCCRSSCLREDCRKRFEEHGEIPSQDYTSWQQQVCWSSCDCWYYLSRVACWDSAEGWLGWPWKCIWFNAGMVNLLKTTNLILLLKQKVRRVARSPLKGSPLNLFSQLFGQNKANTDPAVSSRHQGRTPVSVRARADCFCTVKPLLASQHALGNEEISYSYFIL